MSQQPPMGSVPLVPLARGLDGRWTVAGAITFVMAIMGTAMLVSLVAQQGYLAYRGAGAEGAGAVPRGVQQGLFLILQLGGQLLELALIGWLASRFHRDPLAALDLRPARLTARQWGGAIALLFVMKIVATMVAAGISPSNPREDLSPYIELARSRSGWLVFLSVVVLAGATEELLFRGVLSRTLEATPLGFWGGAGAASAAFAMLHMQYGPGGQFVIFIIGMTLAWIRAWSGSVWPAIVCHCINNAVALLAMLAIT